MSSDDTPQISFIKSKTVWFNFIAGIVVVVATHLVSVAQSGQLPAELLKWSAMIITLGNVLIRFLDGGMPKIGTPAIALVTALTMSSVSFAAPPKATIKGPAKAIYGDRVVFEAVGATSGDQVRWQVTRNDGLPALHTVNDSQRQVEVHFIPGLVDVQLIVANTDGIDISSIRSQISPIYPAGPSPMPTPGPTPVPPQPDPQPVPPQPTPTPVPPQPEPQPTPLPTPDVVDGKFGVAKAVFERAKAVKSANLKQDCGKLVNALESTAARINAGTLKGAVSIMQAYAAANGEAIRGNETAWSSFGTWLQTELSKKYLAGVFKSDADYAALMLEIASGLKPLR